MRRLAATLGVLLFAATSAGAQAPANQRRIATWNVSEFGLNATRTNNRLSAFQTSIYGNTTTGQGAMAPDVLIGQEFYNTSGGGDLNGTTVFVNLLNTAPGSPGDWAVAPYVNGIGDGGDSAFFYRTSRVAFVGQQIVNPAGSAPSNQPRDTFRYDFRFTDDPTSTLVAAYSLHLKSGSGSADNADRLAEATYIRNNARGIDTNGSLAGSGLPAGALFLAAGDTNVQDSSQTGYQKFVGTDGNTAGQFFDPINSPGNWNNNGAFRYIHTQAPGAGSAGMDDRHDQILLSNGFFGGGNLTYRGDRTQAYSTSTWNDPNHSYRAWGNDGTSFNQSLTVTNNAMVGATVAQALVTSQTVDNTGGHLPVFLDIRLPTAVPEPTALGLLLLGLPWVRKRRQASR